MAARLDWRHIAVNQKILVKIRKFWRAFTLSDATGRTERQAALAEKFALQLFA